MRREKLRPHIATAIECLRDEVSRHIDDYKAMEDLEQGWKRYIINMCFGQIQPHGRYSSMLAHTTSLSLKEDIRELYTPEEWDKGVASYEVIRTLLKDNCFEDVLEDARQWLQDSSELAETDNPSKHY